MRGAKPFYPDQRRILGDTIEVMEMAEKLSKDVGGCELECMPQSVIPHVIDWARDIIDERHWEEQWNRL